ncbi:hypothetical protein Ahu01nite_088870 [Winogradskya humida]|uniref:Uncharacterized protein n=1 Tax=Winogradskya humida TaxID=113566 RepID=A0ABQ4A4L3_9ACTN|nr:hypothetical protein Ahu01nite_088870 [Actinoplanes humidus]
MGPDPHIGGNKGGTVVRLLGEHPQRLTKGNRGLVGHPGQLPATHHADNRKTSSIIHRPTSLSTPRRE